ncbi:glycosyltransferase family 8 protein [Pelagibius sp.]|uniref:glycosyltransferase family 8 protein n=1 Tax=Pelagibius sp. TaxID=1931238 RepID=UPI002610763D|nr:glycosyltransferase family 8 protein [Pelagibius sp.]
MTTAPIKLVFGVDGSYSQHLAVTLVSLLENNPDNVFDIVAITLNMGAEDQAKLRGIAEGNPRVSLRFQPFNIDRYSHFRTDNHISHASYLRIFIPEILEDVERVLYLDCDMVVQTDLAPLWASDLAGRTIGAVHNPFFVRHGDLQMSPGADYFNAGVLLLDLGRWRQLNATEHLIRFIEAHHAHLYAHDQDALNAIFEGDITELPPHWNFQTSMLWCEPEGLSMSYRAFRNLLLNPGIIHYTTPSKPWHFLNTHPHKDIYYQYLAKTPYHGFRPRDVSLGSVLRRVARWPLVAFRDRLPAAYYPTRRAFRQLKGGRLALTAQESRP